MLHFCESASSQQSTINSDVKKFVESNHNVVDSHSNRGIGGNGTIRQKIVTSVNASSYVPLSEKIRRRGCSRDVPFFSVEFFPPRTDRGASNLVRLLDEFADGEPFFCDITWHAAGEPGRDKPTSSITTAGVALNYCCLDTMLHMTCIGLTAADLRGHLERAKKLGIRNVLALRGDKHDGCSIYDFEYAADMVRFIRREYGDYFTIVVAGYPVPHPESSSKEHDLQCLKQKVDAGADAIITQLFFEIEDFIDFVRNCRRIGITVPIIPGICSINNYQSIVKFASLSGVPIPEWMSNDLQSIKTNDEAVRNYGIHLLVQVCRKLIDANLSSGLHFYTLNQNTIISVLKAIGLWRKVDIRRLPWRTAANFHRRNTETVRPVFWANRPKSYMHRTSHWCDYPATWNANISLQIANILVDYYPFLERNSKKEEMDTFWSDDPCTFGIYRMFHAFYANNCLANDCETNGTLQNAKRFSTLPWIQNIANKHFIESVFRHYGEFMLKGLLVINYLPGFNGIRSTDQRYGWGEADGYIYQKHYIEFFLDARHFERLKSILEERKSITNYCAIDYRGSIRLCNWPQHHPISLSWGLFSNYQLIPAYIADVKTFNIWRSEAFELFDRWLQLYPLDSLPHRLIQRVQEDYLLISLIENKLFEDTDGKEKDKIEQEEEEEEATVTVSTATDAFREIFRLLFE